MHQKRNITFVRSIACVIFLFAVTVSSSFAYDTDIRWPDNVTIINYTIDPNIASKLGVSSAISVIDNNAVKWTNASLAYYQKVSTWPNGNIVTTANFRTVTPCPTVNDTWYSVNCTYASAGRLTATKIYFNTSPTYTWNSSGTMDCTATPKKADFVTTSLHEMGHSLKLKDSPAGHTEAVMYFNRCVAKQSLAEDDKQGAHQMYGPWDGWEVQSMQGELNRVTYAPVNVVGYNNLNSSLPERYPVSAEFGVPLISGARYDHIAGYARTNSANVYFTVAHDEKDTSSSKTYFTIQSGMCLVWDQYNYQQSTASVDFAMTDETRLQFTGLTDQSGVGLSPKYRYVYATRVWHTFRVNLSPLAGKKVRRWMYGYDNSLTGQTGQFRVYFENLRIEEGTNCGGGN